MFTHSISAAAAISPPRSAVPRFPRLFGGSVKLESIIDTFLIYSASNSFWTKLTANSYFCCPCMQTQEMEYLQLLLVELHEVRLHLLQVLLRCEVLALDVLDFVVVLRHFWLRLLRDFRLEIQNLHHLLRRVHENHFVVLLVHYWPSRKRHILVLGVVELPDQVNSQITFNW